MKKRRSTNKRGALPPLIWDDDDDDQGRRRRRVPDGEALEREGKAKGSERGSREALARSFRKTSPFCRFLSPCRTESSRHSSLARASSPSSLARATLLRLLIPLVRALARTESRTQETKLTNTFLLPKKQQNQKKCPKNFFHLSLPSFFPLFFPLLSLPPPK